MLWTVLKGDLSAYYLFQWQSKCGVCTLAVSKIHGRILQYFDMFLTIARFVQLCDQLSSFLWRLWDLCVIYLGLLYQGRWNCFDRKYLFFKYGLFCHDVTCILLSIRYFTGGADYRHFFFLFFPRWILSWFCEYVIHTLENNNLSVFALFGCFQYE